MSASRSVVSMLVRELGDVSLHPQGRPAGGDAAATGQPAHPPNGVIPSLRAATALPRRSRRRQRGSSTLKLVRGTSSTSYAGLGEVTRRVSAASSWLKRSGSSRKVVWPSRRTRGFGGRAGGEDVVGHRREHDRVGPAVGDQQGRLEGAQHVVAVDLAGHQVGADRCRHGHARGQQRLDGGAHWLLPSGAPSTGCRAHQRRLSTPPSQSRWLLDPGWQPHREDPTDV